MSQVVINIDGEFTPTQTEAILAIGGALREFLVASNETATTKGNELAKLAGIARKSIVGETNPKKKGTK